MKFVFEWPVRTLSGTRDKTTYMNFWDYICIGRTWVMPATTPQQGTLTVISQNLRLVWKDANPLYKADFKTYAQKFRTEKLSPYVFPPRSYSIFIDLMYAWRDSDPEHIDLASVTIEDIVTLDANVRAVSKAVDAGFLAPVSDYNLLANDIEAP